MYEIFFYHQETQLLQIRAQKHHPKKKNPKNNKVTQDIEEYIQQPKTHKIMITQMIMVKLLTIHQEILLKKIMSRFQVKMTIFLRKNQNISMENR